MIDVGGALAETCNTHQWETGVYLLDSRYSEWSSGQGLQGTGEMKGSLNLIGNGCSALS